MIITIAGKAASGKTTLANQIASAIPNTQVISMDEINSLLILKDNEVKEFALKLFGEDIIEEDEILKDKIAYKIYKDENLYNAWVSFMKTKCENLVLALIEKNPSKNFVIEHIIINETKFASMANYKILIIANEQDRIFRVINRDDRTIEQLQFRERFLKVYNLNEFHLVYDGNNPNFVIDQVKALF